METIKNMDYSNIDNTIPINIDNTDPDLDKYPDYNGELTVDPYVNSAGEDIKMKTLIIEISWGDADENSVSLKTRVAEK